ncbi:MAG: SGNH/GDSL hydrolase family protein [Spirochaetota bacterium]
MATICIRGGAIPAGHNVTTSYVDLLEHDPAFQHHTFKNISKLGDSSFEGVWQFEEVLSCKPDIIILHFGMDDIYRPVYKSEFKENLVRMVQKARALLIEKIIFPTLHIVDDKSQMEAFEIYTRLIREVAFDLHCSLATVHLEWMNYCYVTGNSISTLLSEDSRYPNEKGHALIAEAIKKKLLYLL